MARHPPTPTPSPKETAWDLAKSSVFGANEHYSLSSHLPPANLMERRVWLTSLSIIFNICKMGARRHNSGTKIHGLLWRINSSMYTKCLSHSLAESKHLINDGWHISPRCTCFPKTSCPSSGVLINFLLKKIYNYLQDGIYLVILWEATHWSPALCQALYPALKKTKMQETWVSKNKSLVNMSI